jgi:hypothetical protein
MHEALKKIARIEVQNLPNKACTGRLGLCAFFGVGFELWQFSVSELCSPQPPVTRAVRRTREKESP